VACRGDAMTAGQVSVIIGFTTTTPLNAGIQPYSVVVNPVTNKVYVGSLGFVGSIPGRGPADQANIRTFANNLGTLTVIDGATNINTGSVSGVSIPQALAVNPVTNQIYVASFDSNDVKVLTEQQVQPIPLTTVIEPLPGNQIVNPLGAAFVFDVASSYTPIVPPIRNLYFQVDTWQGQWLKATAVVIGSHSASFTAGTPLLPGVHIVYAYATDGQFADSIQTGRQSSPIPGAIAAYLFVVVPNPTTTVLNLLSGTNPSSFGQSLTFGAFVSPSFVTGTVQFKDGSSDLGAPVVLANSSALLTTSALAAGVHNLTAVFIGDSNFAGSVSPPFAQAVMATSGTATSTSLTATPKTFFRGSAIFVVVVNSSSPPSGTAILLDGNKQLGPLLAISSTGNTGIALYSTPLNIGEHHIRAVFLGTTGLSSGSFSTTQTVNASPRPKPR